MFVGFTCDGEETGETVLDGYCDGSGVDMGVPGAEVEHATARRMKLYLESAIDLLTHACRFSCVVCNKLIFASMAINVNPQQS